MDAYRHALQIHDPEIYAEIAGDILCPAPAGGFWPLMSRRDPRR